MKENQSGQQPAFSLPLVLLIVMSIVSVYFFIKYQQTKNLLTNPNIAVQTEIKKLVGQIGKLIELPTDEVPSMATVTDKNKLTNQAFFANAKNGDKILLYQKNHKAILYRPAINKIIEVSQINLEASSSASTITPTKTNTSPTPTIQTKGRLVIYNGTKIAGLAVKEKDLVLSKTTNLDVVQVGNTKNDYTENLVISLKVGNENAAKQLANLVSGKVISLPQSETAPDADLLLIVGKE